MKKNKVILVNPSLSYHDEPIVQAIYPFSALMIFGTMLNEAGYEVALVDGNRYTINETMEKIKNEIDDSVIYIGFSVMTCQVPWTYKVIKAIKSYNREVKIVLGGFHPSIYPEQTIGCEYVDVIAVNEFAQHFLKLTQVLRDEVDLEEVPSIYFRRDGKIIKTSPGENDDINKMPFINFDLYDIDYYKSNNLYASQSSPLNQRFAGFFLTSLGCAYKCNFCYNSILKRHYRYRSAETMVERIEYLQKKYGFDFIQLSDEDFFTNINRFYRFVDVLKEKDIKCSFWTCARASHFREGRIKTEYLKKLAEIGNIMIVIGIESADDSTLELLNKKTTVADNINAVTLLINSGIKVRASCMVGIPGESEKSILETFRFNVRLKDQFRSMFDCVIYTFLPYPGSPLFNRVIEKYEYEQPQSFEDWAAVNYDANKVSSGAMFYNAQERPWISNKKALDLYLNYFYFFLACAQRVEDNRKMSIIFKSVNKLIVLRFKYNLFLVPFELWLLKFYRHIKSQLS
jgi:radical SAM superfamily enzyme YgiQ (UPF0313 family)